MFKPDPDRWKLKTELGNFYRENTPDLTPITGMNHRHIRVALPSGRFLKIPDVIRKGEDLLRWLLKLKPFHVYYSTGCWLKPVTLSPRPKKPGFAFLKSGIILSHDIAFDIDKTPLLQKNLEAARQEALKLLDFMTEKGYPRKYISFSGSKGFHLVYHDPDPERIADPFQREMRLMECRGVLLKEVLEQGIQVDTSVTKDTRRIIRVPGTINTRTGYACTVLEKRQLEMELCELLEGVPRLPSTRPIPRFALPGFGAFRVQRPLLPWLAGWCSSIGRFWSKEVQDEKKDIHGYTSYLQSAVLGTRGRHAVLLTLKHRSRKRLEGQLRELMKDFKLTDFYLFKRPGAYIAISLRTLQRNRYQKLLDRVGAANAGLLLKYNVSSVQVGALVGTDMVELEPHVRFITTLQAPEHHNESQFISAGHLSFIKKHGIETFDYPKLHGSLEFKLLDAVLKL